MTDFAIEVDHVSKNYGPHQAVSDVSFQITPGQIVGFLGPNGAGKTTTLRMITGYLGISAGAVRIAGIDVEENVIEARKRFGYMPEGAPLYGEMRVREYLSYRAKLKGVRGKASVTEHVERALQQANIVDVKERIIAQLSKGYRQRVALADALVANPDILVLDEPSAGLDPNQIRELRAVIRSFAQKKAVLLSTHILSEVEAICDRVIVIHQGKLVADKTLQELQSGNAKLENVFAQLTGVEMST